METRDSEEKRPSYILILAFLILTVGIVTAGYLYYRNYEKQYRLQVEKQLSSIAELKAEELVDWRKERLSDAATFYKNSAFFTLVRRCFENPQDMEAKGHLRSWISQVQSAYQYDRGFLLDARGVERMSVPDTPELVAPHLLQHAPEILRSGKVVFLDFHRDVPDGPIHLAILVPIFDGQDTSRAIALLVLRIDPEKYLYPFLNRWPIHSRTAETLLIRREGNDAVFLNELKFQKNTALNLRVSLEKKELPAVQAALGHEGIVEGRDYRGVPVIADVRRVPDTPWFIVARMDTSEVYAPVRERLWEIAILICVLLFGTGAGIGLVWRQQRVLFYRERSEKAEALWESEKRYRALFESINDAVFVQYVEGEGSPGCFIQVNDVACQRLGYTREELLGLTSRDITPPEEYTKLLDKREKLMSRGNIVVETVHVTKDGRQILVESSVRLFDYLGKRAEISISRDITERKKMEEEREKMIKELQRAMHDIKTLRGIIPICSSCKKIRDDKGYWHQVEVYISDHSEADFSHGICEECARKLYPGIYKDRG